MNNIENINTALLSAVAKIKCLPQDSFNINSDIVYDLYFDSVDLIDLLTYIENDLNVVIDDSELENFTTILSISRAVMQCKAQK